MIIADISKFLSIHSGRDKVMRTLSNTSKLVSCLTTSETMSKKLDIFGSRISACRIVLRLFDDLPMLNYTLMYGLGREEPDLCMRILGILINAADQLYFPLEHIAWASDQKLISVRSTPWSTASAVCWAVSLYLSLIKSLRYMAILQNHKSCLKDTDCNLNVPMDQLLAQQRYELLTAFRCMGDLVQAIHSLPDGFLWSGKLKKWHIGLLGTLTSIIGLYQAYHKTVVPKKNA